MYPNSTSDTGRNIIILTSYNYCKKKSFYVCLTVIYIETYNKKKHSVTETRTLVLNKDLLRGIETNTKTYTFTYKRKITVKYCNAHAN